MERWIFCVQGDPQLILNQRLSRTTKHQSPKQAWLDGNVQNSLLWNEQHISTRYTRCLFPIILSSWVMTGWKVIYLTRLLLTILSPALPSPTVRISTKQPRWRPTDPDTCDKDGWGVATQRICIRPWKNVVFVQKMYSPIIKRVNTQLGSWRVLTARLKRPLRKVFSSPPVAFLWLLYYFLLQSTSKAVYLVDVFVDSEPVIWVLSQFNVPKGGDRDWGFAFVLYSLVFWQQGPFWWTNSMLLFLPAGGTHRHRGSHNPNRQLEKDRKI